MNGEGWKIFRHKERAHSQSSEKQRILKMEGQNQEKKKILKLPIRMRVHIHTYKHTQRRVLNGATYILSYVRQ